MAKFDEHGREVLDQTPRALPVKFRTRSHAEDIRALVRQEMSRMAAEQGMESFEEADDFNVGDDFDPSSPYEMTFDPMLGPDESFEEERPSAKPKADSEQPPSQAAQQAGSSADQPET